MQLNSRESSPTTGLPPPPRLAPYDCQETAPYGRLIDGLRYATGLGRSARSRKRVAYAGVPTPVATPSPGYPGADAGIVTPRLGALIAANGATRRWRPPFRSNEQL